MPTSRTVPIEVVGSLIEIATSRGWVVEDLLAGAGVDPSLLLAERGRVTEDQLVAVAQAVWRHTDDELFGLSKHPLPRGTFRLLCYALLGAADLREAMQRLQGFLQAIPAIPVAIDLSEAEEVAVVVEIEARTELDRFVIAGGLGAVSRLLSWMLRQNLDLQVQLPFPRPDDVEGLETMLDGPITFDAPRAAIVLGASWLGAPLMRDERDVEELIATSPRALLQRPRYRQSTSEQVRRIIEAGIRDGAVPTADDLARRLAMSPQTLRRRLAEAGTSARDLSDVVRRDAAIAALVDTDETVAELGERLGFSEPSAFVRAFRRWTGSTPGAYRKASD